MATTPLVFGSVLGGTDEELRLRSARETAARPVDGFVLGGLDLGESPVQRAELLRTSLSALPEGKPRIIVQSGGPMEALQTIRMGVDVVVSGYPAMVTQMSLASSFWIDDAGGERENSGNDAGRNPVTLDVRDRQFVEDTRPLVRRIREATRGVVRVPRLALTLPPAPRPFLPSFPCNLTGAWLPMRCV